MHLLARARRFLVRHPSLYWLVVVACATGIALEIDRRVDELDDERSRWGTTRNVLVAAHDLAPDDDPAVREVELPEVAVPPGALAELPDGARLRRPVGVGEIVVAADVASGPGPASRAQPGRRVVAVRDPLAHDLAVGIDVEVAADGVVLAADARIVEVVDDVAFVAVDAADAAAVAAAARVDAASLVYVP